MWRHIHAARWIWNYMLDIQNQRYARGEKYLTAFDMINLLKPLKNDGEHGWLYDVSNATLTCVCQDLDTAFKRCFKHVSNYPKYKSRKHSKLAFPLCQTKGKTYLINHTVHMQCIGNVPYKTDLPVREGRSVKIVNPRITYTSNGKWILSFCYECEKQACPLTDASMGIDLGIKDLAVVAFGEQKIVYKNIYKTARLRNLESKMKHLQRNVDRKRRYSDKRSHNLEKTYVKIRKLHNHIANIYNDYRHKMTRDLVNKKPRRVVMETLNTQGMLKTHHLSRFIKASGFYAIGTMMKYKCEHSGIEFVQTPMFFPSSKTCSKCGNVKDKLSLSERVYRCNVCGLRIDRDYNAAINLMNYSVNVND